MKFFKQIDYSSILGDEQYFLDCIKKYKVLVVKSYIFNTPITEFIENYIKKFGKIVDSQEDLKTGVTTGEQLMEISFDPEDQKQYRTAKANQPLHTDYSYVNVDNNIQFLMCVKKAPIGGATTFIDTRLLVELLLADNEEVLFNDLLSIPVLHAKGNRVKRRCILEKVTDDYKINWNYPPAKRALNTHAAKDLIERFKNWLDNRVEKSGLVHSVLLKNNDTVFFHDYRVLHGRNCYFASKKGDRCLLKSTLIIG